MNPTVTPDGVTPEFTESVAEFYANIPNQPQSMDAAQSWRELITEVKRLVYEIPIPIVVTKEDPYAGLAGLIDGIESERVLYVYSTAETGGHPVWTDSENDTFRAFHDYYGHYLPRLDFDRHSEDLTYRLHARQLQRKGSLLALATETRGQNSYLSHYGEFAPQYIGYLPDWAITAGLS